MHIDLETQQILPPFNGDPTRGGEILDLRKDRQEAIWIQQRFAISRVDPKSDKSKIYLTLPKLDINREANLFNRAFFIYLGEDAKANQYWFHSFNRDQIYQYKPEEDRIIAYTLDFLEKNQYWSYGIWMSELLSSLVDHTGTLWMGFGEEMLKIKIDQRRFNTHQLDYYVVGQESIDLEPPHYIDHLVLNWNASFAKTYEVILSDDGENWRSVYRTTNGNGKIEKLPIRQPGRFVKLLLEDKNTVYGISIHELEVWGALPEVIPFHSRANDHLGLPSGTSYDIFQDSHNQIWITTHNGLVTYQYEKHRFERIRPPAGGEFWLYGADAYLIKPFQKRELQIRLEKLIEIRQRLRARFSDGPTPIGDTVAPSQPDLDRAFLSRLEEIIQANLDDTEFGVPALARGAKMSHMQVYRKLKALTGKTPSQFIRSTRLHQGKALLLTTDLTISEIAYQVGFSNPSYFSRTFHDEFNVPPNSFQK